MIISLLKNAEIWMELAKSALFIYLKDGMPNGMEKLSTL